MGLADVILSEGLGQTGLSASRFLRAADAVYSQAMQYYAATGGRRSKVMRAYCYAALGDAMAARGSVETARDYYMRALELSPTALSPEFAKKNRIYKAQDRVESADNLSKIWDTRARVCFEIYTKAETSTNKRNLVILKSSNACSAEKRRIKDRYSSTHKSNGVIGEPAVGKTNKGRSKTLDNEESLYGGVSVAGPDIIKSLWEKPVEQISLARVEGLLLAAASENNTDGRALALLTAKYHQNISTILKAQSILKVTSPIYSKKIEVLILRLDENVNTLRQMGFDADVTNAHALIVLQNSKIGVSRVNMEMLGACVSGELVDYKKEGLISGAISGAQDSIRDTRALIKRLSKRLSGLSIADLGVFEKFKDVEWVMNNSQDALDAAKTALASLNMKDLLNDPAERVVLVKYAIASLVLSNDLIPFTRNAYERTLQKILSQACIVENISYIGDSDYIFDKSRFRKKKDLPSYLIHEHSHNRVRYDGGCGISEADESISYLSQFAYAQRNNKPEQIEALWEYYYFNENSITIFSEHFIALIELYWLIGSLHRAGLPADYYLLLHAAEDVRTERLTDYGYFLERLTVRYVEILGQAKSKDGRFGRYAILDNPLDVKSPGKTDSELVVTPERFDAIIYQAKSDSKKREVIGKAWKEISKIKRGKSEREYGQKVALKLIENCLSYEQILEFKPEDWRKIRVKWDAIKNKSDYLEGVRSANPYGKTFSGAAAATLANEGRGNRDRATGYIKLDSRMNEALTGKMPEVSALIFKASMSLSPENIAGVLLLADDGIIDPAAILGQKEIDSADRISPSLKSDTALLGQFIVNAVDVSTNYRGFVDRIGKGYVDPVLLAWKPERIADKGIIRDEYLALSILRTHQDIELKDIAAVSGIRPAVSIKKLKELGESKDENAGLIMKAVVDHRLWTRIKRLCGLLENDPSMLSFDRLISEIPYLTEKGLHDALTILGRLASRGHSRSMVLCDKLLDNDHVGAEPKELIRRGMDSEKRGSGHLDMKTRLLLKAFKKSGKLQTVLTSDKKYDVIKTLSRAADRNQDFLSACMRVIEPDDLAYLAKNCRGIAGTGNLMRSVENAIREGKPFAGKETQRKKQEEPAAKPAFQPSARMCPSIPAEEYPFFSEVFNVLFNKTSVAGEKAREALYHLITNKEWTSGFTERELREHCYDWGLAVRDTSNRILLGSMVRAGYLKETPSIRGRWHVVVYTKEKPLDELIKKFEEASGRTIGTDAPEGIDRIDVPPKTVVFDTGPQDALDGLSSDYPLLSMLSPFSQEELSAFVGKDVKAVIVPHEELLEKVSKELKKDAIIIEENAGYDMDGKRRNVVCVLEGDVIYVSETAPRYLVYNAVSLHELDMLRTKYGLGVTDAPTLERMSYMSDALGILEYASLAQHLEGLDPNAHLFVLRIAEQELKTLCSKTGRSFTLKDFVSTYGKAGNLELLILGLQKNEFELTGIRTPTQNTIALDMPESLSRPRDSLIEQHKKNLKHIAESFHGTLNGEKDPVSVGEKVRKLYIELAELHKQARLAMLEQYKQPTREANEEGECADMILGTVSLNVSKGKTIKVLGSEMSGGKVSVSGEGRVGMVGPLYGGSVSLDVPMGDVAGVYSGAKLLSSKDIGKVVYPKGGEIVCMGKIKEIEILQGEEYSGSIYAKEFPFGFTENAWKEGIVAWKMEYEGEVSPEIVSDIARRFRESLAQRRDGLHILGGIIKRNVNGRWKIGYMYTDRHGIVQADGYAVIDEAPRALVTYPSKLTLDLDDEDSISRFVSSTGKDLSILTDMILGLSGLPARRISLAKGDGSCFDRPETAETIMYVNEVSLEQAEAALKEMRHLGNPMEGVTIELMKSLLELSIYSHENVHGRLRALGNSQDVPGDSKFQVLTGVDAKSEGLALYGSAEALKVLASERMPDAGPVERIFLSNLPIVAINFDNLRFALSLEHSPQYQSETEEVEKELDLGMSLAEIVENSLKDPKNPPFRTRITSEDLVPVRDLKEFDEKGYALWEGLAAWKEDNVEFPEGEVTKMLTTLAYVQDVISPEDGYEPSLMTKNAEGLYDLRNAADDLLTEWCELFCCQDELREVMFKKVPKARSNLEE